MGWVDRCEGPICFDVLLLATTSDCHSEAIRSGWSKNLSVLLKHSVHDGLTPQSAAAPIAASTRDRDSRGSSSK
jgi:hypothetical protein